MENPYGTPKAELTVTGNTHGRSGLLFWLVAIGATLLSAGAGLFGIFAIPQFAELFNAFGGEIPAPTQFVVSHGFWLLLLPLVTVLIWIRWYGARQEKVRHPIFLRRFMALAAVDIAVVAVVIWALYLPIFKMYEAVQ